MAILDPKTDKEAAWREFYLLRNREGEYNKTIDAEVRRAVMESQNWRCCYCDVEMKEGIANADSYLAATIDHIRQRQHGGSNRRENLVGACKYCNSSRGDFEAVVWYNHIQWLKNRGEHPHFPAKDYAASR